MLSSFFNILTFYCPGPCGTDCKFVNHKLYLCTLCKGLFHHLCDGEGLDLNVCKKCSDVNQPRHGEQTEESDATKAPECVRAEGFKANQLQSEQVFFLKDSHQLSNRSNETTRGL